MAKIIGIDTGVQTGYAVWDTEAQEFEAITSTLIHRVLEELGYARAYQIFVRVEDARLRKWFGKSGREKLQGAGSVKRDAKIFEDFLTDHKIPFELVSPADNTTKTTADYFKQLTGWQGRTNEHGRDAAMLVYGFSERRAQILINQYKEK